MDVVRRCAAKKWHCALGDLFEPGLERKKHNENSVNMFMIIT